MILWRSALLACLLASLSNVQAIVYQSPSAIAGVNAPTIMLTHQASWDWSIFQKNYSIFVGGSGCSGQYPSGPVAQGKILWHDGDSLSCSLSEVQRNARTAGAVAVMHGSPVAELNAALIFYYEPDPSLGLPVFTTQTLSLGSKGPAQVTLGEIIGNLLFSSLYPAVFQNVTVLLTEPVQNEVSLEVWSPYAPNRYTAVYWLGVLISIVVLGTATAKWALFVQFEGLKLSFPQVQMIVCFMGGFFILFFSIQGPYGLFYATVLHDAVQFFTIWPWCFVITSMVLLGLYFREIATLTSAQTVPGLNVLRWPAIGIIVVLWGAFIAGGALAANDPVDTGGVTGNAQFVFAFFIISMALAGFLLIWGCISVLRVASSASENARKGIYRLCLFCGIVIVLTWSFGIMAACFNSYVVETGSFMTLAEAVLAVQALSIFPPAVCLMLIMLNFRVEVSKDIELSKSGTSSTSGVSGMSSSSSSSSSASQNDPVIEL